MIKIRKKLDKIIVDKTKELKKVGLEIKNAKHHNEHGLIYESYFIGGKIERGLCLNRVDVPYHKKHAIYKSFFDEVVDLVGGRIEYITISSIGEEIDDGSYSG